MVIVLYTCPEGRGKLKEEREVQRMIIDHIYRIQGPDNKINDFQTSLTEREFYQTLDAVYGPGNYQTLEVKEVLK